MAVYPDLTNARRLVERAVFGDDNELAATVRITLDPAGAGDDTFNTTTGLWTRVGQTTVYEGKAGFRANNPEQDLDIGGSNEIRGEWALKLPLSFMPTPGSFVLILTCARDPLLVGKEFRIERVLGSSMGVLRRCTMHEYTSGPREIP